jgi:hypothetical protein
MVRALWLPLQIALAVLFGLILAGAPVVVTIGAFLLALYLSVRAALYRAEFVLDESGITEALTPFNTTWTWRKPRTQRFRWDQVVDWSIDEELTRGYQLRKRLIIRFRDPTHSIRLDEVGGEEQRAAYSTFVNAFLVRAGGESLPPPAELPTRIPPDVVRERVAWPEGAGALRRRRAFLSRPAGKLTGMLLIVLVIAAGSALFLLGGSVSSWYRLIFVLVPGALYLGWRIFFRR